MCRTCEKEPENHARVLPGRSSLTHSKYVNNKNAAPKVLFFEVLRDVKFADYVHPWYPRMELKPMYESNDVQIDYMAKKVLSMEMAVCGWKTGRERPLRRYTSHCDGNLTDSTRH